MRHKGSREGHPLLLTAGEFGGSVVQPITEPHLGEDRSGLRAGLFRRPSRDEEGHLYILLRAEDGQQVVRLEHEPCAAGTVFALFGVRHRVDVGPLDRHRAPGDVVEAAEERELFVHRLKEKVNLVSESDTKEALQLGADGWPFPIPLVKQGGQWFFDTEAGKEEILNRRIGANELGAIHVCRAYVQAQREYASEDRGDGILEYAQHLRSTPGKHNGLFWPAKPGEELSPLGPLVAAARVEGYHRAAKMLNDEQAPYHGYYFKILTRQGKHAAGGKYDYIINGRMIAGFALVAWPTEWGNTGVMTFIVNQQGKVYQCNLGKKTAKLAAAMTRFDPDSRWTPVP